MSTIQLQSIGHVPAIQASEVREGDVKMYNFGSCSTIIKVIEKTDKTLTIIEFSHDSKNYYMYDVRKTSLVAIVKRDQDISEHKPQQASYRRKGLVDVSEYFQTEEIIEETPVKDENNMKNYKYEVYNVEQMKGNMNIKKAKCRIYNLDDTQIEVFDLIISKEDGYQAWIGDVTNETTLNRRKEIEKELNQTIEINKVIEHQQTETVSEPQTAQISYQTGTGNKGNGIEITFENKPNEEVRNAIKAAGYRWGGKQRPNIWWAIETNESLSIAEQLATKQQTEPIDYSYPEIEIDDNESYIIDQSLQDREHDSAWIFRQNKIDHNKEIQNMFNDYTNQVKSILGNTSNEYFIYKLKSSLQRFKKKYHSLYIKYLSHKANNPSWAVTGRGNLNISKYNQAMQRQNNIMSELADLPKQFERELIKYRNKIKKGA